MPRKWSCTYHSISHPVAEEMSVTVTTGEDVASLMFFTGRRAVTAIVPEFKRYAERYTPCYVYWKVPLVEVESFLAAHATGDTTGRLRHG
jgi:hypothetical protein